MQAIGLFEIQGNVPAVVAVDRSGVITTMSDGIANITAVAGGVAGTCTITVIAPTIREPIDYGVDGVSYGKGIVIPQEVQESSPQKPSPQIVPIPTPGPAPWRL